MRATWEGLSLRGASGGEGEEEEEDISGVFGDKRREETEDNRQ